MTTESFLETLETSKLLGEEQLESSRDFAEKNPDAKQFAKLLVRKKILTRWQAGQLLAGRTSFYLGKYRLIDLLGRGGMGSVFFAKHITMNRQVALKIISKQLGSDPKSLERFFTEARAIAALDHPNIIHAYNVDNEGDRYYIVMEFVEGQDLQRLVESKGPLEPGKAAEYIRQTAEGLAHAHGRNMIHCDIKPANLLMNEQGVVKILDMGMARAMGLEGGVAEEKQSEEQLVGTVDYLSPEQAEQRSDMDHRVDIYALGCTLYFLLSGNPPFPEGSIHERLLKHTSEEPPSLFSIRRSIPKNLVKVCEKMMAKDPDDRFQTAEEVAKVLASWRPAAPPPKVAADSKTPDSGVTPMAIQIKTDRPSKAAATFAGVVPEEPTEPDKSETTGDDTMAEKPVAKANRGMMIILAGMGGLVLLVLAINGILFYRLMSRESEENPSPEPAVAQAPDTVEEPAEEYRDPDSSSEPNTKPPTEMEIGSDLLGGNDPTEVTTTPNTESETPVETPPVKPAEEPASVTPIPEPPVKAPPKAEPPAKEPAEVKPPNPPKKNPPKKNPPKKPENLFAGLPKSIDLPAPKKGEEPVDLQLGKIASKPGEPWQLYLLGGESVFKSSPRLTRKFALEERDTNPATAKWVIQYEETKAGSVSTPAFVAGLLREGNVLKFRWAKGIDDTLASNLRNCVFQVRDATEGKSHYMPLRTPVEPEAIRIDLLRRSSTAMMSIRGLPDDIVFRVTKVEGLEDCKIDPSEGTLKKPVTLKYVHLDKNQNETAWVEFRISFLKKSSGLTATLTLMSDRVIQDLFKLCENEVGRIARRNEIDLQSGKIQKRLAEPKKEKQPSANEKALLNNQLLTLGMEKFFIDAYEKIHQKVQVHFQIESKIEGYDQPIVLVRSVPAAPLPEPKKAPEGM